MAELLIAGGLVVGASAVWAACAAAALLLVFCVAIGRVLARGKTPDCHCFGNVGAAPVGRGTIVRNLVLVGLAGFVVIAGWDGAGMSVPRLAADLGAVAVVLGVAMVLHVAFSWQLFAQNGRLLERVSALEAALGGGARKPTVESLRIGDRAPDFALSNLEGDMVTLRELLRPGRGVVLVFTDPGCGHCHPLLPALGRVRGDDEPALAVISRGSPEQNRANAREHGITSMLLQHDFEIAEAYRTYGMPSAYLVDAGGRIASEHAGGPEAVGKLLAPPSLAVWHATADRSAVYEEATRP